MDKSGMVNLRNWPELLALILLFIGFILSLTSGSAFVSYILIVLCGGIAGRIWWAIGQAGKFAGLLIISGFLAGFLLGSYYASKAALIILFLIGAVLSYYLHKEKIISTLGH